MSPPASLPTRTLAGELLATTVTLATLVGGVRLFDGASFLAPVLGAALLAHLLVALLRRAGRGVALSAAVSAIGVAGLQVWVHYPHTTSYGLPRRATAEAFATDIGGIGELLRSSEVPLAEDRGLIVVAAAVAWLIALLSDWAAFRVGARGEALAPAAILLGLVATFGTPGGTILYPTIILVCAVAFALAHAAARSAARPVVSASGLGRRHLPRGLVTGALAVGAGALITSALLPSLSDGPLRTLLEPSAPAADGGRKVVLSPLVAVPGQLLQNPDLELFTVRSTGRSYWRLTALGDFDGVVWSLDESTGAAGESLPTQAATSGPVSDLAQSYRISALAAVWLPAAYQPVAFEPLGTFEASFEPNSSTLLVGSGRTDSDGLAYTVQSELPRFDRSFLASLRNDPADVPPGFVDLPANLSPSLAEAAAAVTAGRDGPYEQALTLQEWLREGFEYDLDVTPGHSVDRLEAFLFGERRGYCEQFAGAFATLARTLGLPTRVAVGFTPGVALETDATGRTLYSVRGQHAHAWPEVYISGAGWVAFEPTPGRGAPGAESYTFVPEQQDSPLESLDATVPEQPPAGPGPNVEGPAPAAPSPPTAAEIPDEGGGISAARAAGLAGLALAAAVAAGGLYAVATAGLRSVQRRQRHRWAAGDAGRGAVVAWEEVVDLLRPRRIRPHRSETPLEVAQRAAHLLGSAPEPWQRLAFCVSVAAFAGGPMPPELTQQAAAAASAITADLRESRTAAQRLRRAVDPRPWGLLVRARHRRGGAPGSPAPVGVAGAAG